MLHYRRPEAATFVYHYYGGTGPVWLDATRPIVPAIATLRRFTDAKVVVLEVGGGAEWGPYPKLLDFEVRQAPLHYPHVDLPDCTFWNALGGRCRDLLELPERDGPIVCSDYDVYWASSPFPLPTAPFQYASYNSGVWILDPRRAEARWHLRVMRDLLEDCLEDADLRAAITASMPNRILSPEQITDFLGYRPGVVERLDPRYNFYFWDPGSKPPPGVLCVHLLSSLHGPARARFVILLKEFSTGLPLPEWALRELFGDDLDSRGSLTLADLGVSPWKIDRI